MKEYIERNTICEKCNNKKYCFSETSNEEEKLKLQDFSNSAEQCKNKDFIILDIRGNYGGADLYSLKFFSDLYFNNKNKSEKFLKNYKGYVREVYSLASVQSSIYSLKKYCDMSIFDKLNKCLKALYHKGKNDRLICKLCQLIGYANMMAGKYDFAIKYWMNQYVECTFNVYTAYSLEYQQALIEYGLCFIKIGEIKMANDHFRGSKIFSYSPEQLKKPWIINSLELLLRMGGGDFVYKKECQRLLNDIIKGIEDQ